MALLRLCGGVYGHSQEPMDAIRKQNRYLDCVLLDNPDTVAGAIAAIEVLKRKIEEGEVRSFGLCNVSADFIQRLLDIAPHLTPAVIQNPFSRFFYNDFDVETRGLCHGPAGLRANQPIYYQGFYVVTGNLNVWKGAPYVRIIAQGAGVSDVAAWFSLVMSANVVVLTGTSNHMQSSLEDIKAVEGWRHRNPEIWGKCQQVFLDAINGDFFQPDTGATN